MHSPQCVTLAGVVSNLGDERAMCERNSIPDLGRWLTGFNTHEYLETQ